MIVDLRFSKIDHYSFLLVVGVGFFILKEDLSNLNRTLKHIVGGH
jgi:hypothetical protein